MPKQLRMSLFCFLIALAVLLGACTPRATTTIISTVTANPTVTTITTTAPPTSIPGVYSLPELKYLLFSQYDVFWCDPDFYPVARPGSEQANAIDQFAAIQANADEFNAILKYLSLDRKASYSDDEKLLIYRQHKKLAYGVQITSSGDAYSFVLRVGQGQGWRYDGTITTSGNITITTKAASFNTCPICLTKGTLIDTPSGLVPVEQLRQGMEVWTLDKSGQRVPAAIVETVATPVPQSFLVVRITLEDGRTVSASPGHPSAARIALGVYQLGDILDGSQIIADERVAYTEGSTYDILPGGGTGLYWANGILLLSTLG
jgi:hypothetical protein